MYLSFKVEGVAELSRKLQTIDRNLKNWNAEFAKTGRFLTRFFSGEVFETRGMAFGESWPALSPRYAAWKAVHFPNKGILERTGRMRRSFEYESGNDHVRVYNLTPYFKYHQSRMARTSNLPRRVMMKLDERRKQTIVKIFHEGIMKSIGRA